MLKYASFLMSPSSFSKSRFFGNIGIGELLPTGWAQVLRVPALTDST